MSAKSAGTLGRIFARILRFIQNRCMELLKFLWNILPLPLKNRLKKLKLLFNILFFNSQTSWYTGLTTATEPCNWLFSRGLKLAGPIFVVVVVLLVTIVLVVFFVCLLPQKFEESPGWALWHLFLGHYVTLNIGFNYFMALKTDPGTPPNSVPEVVSICKKCIAPKPPRTHHCDICKKCVLKMDHHCRILF
ncbi:DgyrCDS11717 [Dimorphilus gyrociliatus]|uniref:Palmitoyltransferase n=1 Tax=Dimorphilus gyrociliatus TaxID=2664684 RepID=A0A7I8W630_9ANNE|nr:DgyrCDS11717 [Dimorphilus gyrociliatus]